MEQKIIWSLYFRLGINLIRIFFSVFLIVSCIGSSDFDWQTTTRITYINETSKTIFVEGISCEVSDILPNSILVYKHVTYQSGTSKKDKPNIDNFLPFVPCAFFYGNTRRCETEVHTREAQENHKQTGDLKFEFTFRFTESRLQNAPVCE